MDKMQSLLYNIILRPRWLIFIYIASISIIYLFFTKEIPVLIIIIGIFGFIQWWVLLYVNHVLDVIKISKTSYTKCIKELSMLYIKSKSKSKSKSKDSCRKEEMLKHHSLSIRYLHDYCDDLKLLRNLGYNCEYDKMTVVKKQLRDLNNLIDKDSDNYMSIEIQIKNSFTSFESSRSKLNDISNDLIMR